MQKEYCRAGEVFTALISLLSMTITITWSLILSTTCNFFWKELFQADECVTCLCDMSRYFAAEHKCSSPQAQANTFNRLVAPPSASISCFHLSSVFMLAPEMSKMTTSVLWRLGKNSEKKASGRIKHRKLIGWHLVYSLKSYWSPRVIGMASLEYCWPCPLFCPPRPTQPYIRLAALIEAPHVI